MVTFNEKTTADEIVNAFKDRVVGKTIVVVGPSAGSIGSETAKALARGHPDKLILLGRDESKVKPVIDSIASIDSAVTAVFVPVHLDRLASVRTAASTVKSLAPKIDYIIDYAAVMANPEFSKTEDDIELQFAVNYVSHFLLDNLLLDNVKAAGSGSRIVEVTSNGYTLGDIDFDDVNFANGKDYEKWTAYGRSKTALILFATRLARKLRSSKIGVYTVHPGGMYYPANHLYFFPILHGMKRQRTDRADLPPPLPHSHHRNRPRRSCHRLQRMGYTTSACPEGDWRNNGPWRTQEPSSRKLDWPSSPSRSKSG